MNKDKANHLSNKYGKTTDVQVEKNPRLTQMREAEARELAHLRCKKEEQEIKKRMISICVDRKTLRYSKSAKLFYDARAKTLK